MGCIVLFASVQEVNFYAELTKYGIIEHRPKARKPSPACRDIIDVVTAFDIETTTLNFPLVDDKLVNSHAFMYVWQFQLNDITIMGRSWDECLQMFFKISDACKRIRKEKQLQQLPVVVIWVHNLAYEFQFLSGLYPFKNDECFFRDIRKPIYCRMLDCLEFRCSYIQTNMSLAHLTKQLKVEQKLSGQQYNYDKIRFPWTPLSEFEIEYCTRDVRSLVTCMQIKMQNDHDNLQTIPLTSTGYVRRDCTAALRERELFLKIKELLPGEKAYRLLRTAFRGGNTHCNRKYSGKIVSDVYSYDMSSCYPAQQLTKKFPMSPFRFLDDRLTFERIFHFIGLGYAVVGLYQFKNIRLRKSVTVPYLSLGRCECFGFDGRSCGYGLDNGRILYADYCKAALTEIDLNIVVKQYEFDEVDVMTAMVAQKHFLPDEYRTVIKRYYENKTKLKGTTDPEELYLYQKSKEKLNGIYGMSAQDPIHAEILYDDGVYSRSSYDTLADVEKTLKKAKFPYQWGVYTTAYARAALQEAIDAAGQTLVYCDTDSIKTVGKTDLSLINKKREKAAIDQGAFADDPKGIRHFMGVFELECKYDRFISCGAKRYAYEIDGKMGITVSGVSKAVNEKTGISFAVEELKKLENFREGFIWHKAAGTMAVYNDEDIFLYNDPDSGNSVQITKNVALLPTTYEMTYSKDYKLLLNDIELYGDYRRERE